MKVHSGRLALALSLVLALPVLAGPVVRSVDPLEVGATDAPLAATCTLAPGSIASISFIWTAPEELTSYAWRIPVSSCAACASTGLITPRSVTFRMRWLKACSATAQVSIVGSKQGATCLEPDTTQVLCATVQQGISGTGNGTVFHTINFQGECCVPSTAFVMLRFVGLGLCGSGGTNPGLAASTAACVPCTQFVTATNIFPNSSEWCNEVGAGNATWLSLAADCCDPVPAHEQSWGTIKSLYR